MHFTIYISLFLFVYPSDGGNTSSIVDREREDVLHITDALLNLLGTDEKNESARIKELRDKVNKIDSYVIDKDKYIERLLNESKTYLLNETNFYNALQEKDHYSIISDKDSRNLYLKLKEKMNRDDLLQVLSEKGKKKMKNSARRIMDMGYLAKRRTEKELDDAVDKYLGEAPHDTHRFNNQDRYSKYWDPQVELIERRSYHQPSGRRLFKGERTTIRYYPFMVSVHVMGQFWCGGAIYWYDLVVTSAACLQLMHNNRFYRENPKALGVRIGSNHSKIGGEFIEALEVYFHPGYKPKTLENNIAVIRMRRHLKINYHRIPKLIELSFNEGGVPSTAEILLLGWGVSKTTQKLPYEPLYLQRKILPVYPNTLCREIYGNQFKPTSMFCAGTVSTGEGACAHDAGGPAILNGKLVGIISYGPTICGFPDAPTVLTLVGTFADWLETVNETIPEYYRAYKRTTTTTPHPYMRFFEEYAAPIEDPNRDAAKKERRKILKKELREFNSQEMRAKASKGTEEAHEEMPVDDTSIQKELRMGNSEVKNYEAMQAGEKHRQPQALKENVILFQQTFAENMKHLQHNKHKDTGKTDLDDGDSLTHKKLSFLRDDTHNEDSSREKKADKKRLQEELHLMKLAREDAALPNYPSEQKEGLETFTTRNYDMELRALLNSHSDKAAQKFHGKIQPVMKKRNKPNKILPRETDAGKDLGSLIGLLK